MYHQKFFGVEATAVSLKVEFETFWRLLNSDSKLVDGWISTHPQLISLHLKQWSYPGADPRSQSACRRRNFFFARKGRIHNIVSKIKRKVKKLLIWVSLLKCTLNFPEHWQNLIRTLTKTHQQLFFMFWLTWTGSLLYRTSPRDSMLKLNFMVSRAPSSSSSLIAVGFPTSPELYSRLTIKINNTHINKMLKGSRVKKKHHSYKTDLISAYQLRDRSWINKNMWYESVRPVGELPAACSCTPAPCLWAVGSRSPASPRFSIRILSSTFRSPWLSSTYRWSTDTTLITDTNIDLLITPSCDIMSKPLHTRFTSIL